MLLALVVVAIIDVSPTDAGSAARARPALEMAALRTATSATFLQPDGSFKTSVYSEPVHFRDGRGDWRKIDAALKASGREGFAWRSGANAFEAEFKDSAAEGLLRFQAADGSAFSLSLEGAEGAARASKSGENVLRYGQVLAGVDLEYALLASGVKERLILRDGSVPNSFRFVLRPEGDAERLRARARADGSVSFHRDGVGQPLFALSAPSVSDSATVRGEAGSRPSLPSGEPPRAVPEGAAVAEQDVVSLGVQRHPDGSFAVTLRVEEAWLRAPERVFPVVVDPTIVSHPSVLDGTYNTDSPASNPNMVESELLVGRNGLGQPKYAAAVKFDLASLPQGARVAAARLNLYWTGCIPFYTGFAEGAGGCKVYWNTHQTGTVEVRRLGAAWSGETPWSGISGSIDSTLLGSYAMTAADGALKWRQFGNLALVQKVQQMVSGELPNYGFLFQKTSGPDDVGFKYASSRYSDVSRVPRLDIEWTADAVQLADPQHLHSDGAELVWQRYTGGLGPYADAVLDDAPTAFWRFDDGPGSVFGLADWTGQGQHGSQDAGVPPLGYGEPGATADGDQAIFFNGTTYAVAGGTPISAITQTFTVEAWVKRATLTGGRYTIFSRGESNGNGFRLLINEANQLELAAADWGRSVAKSSVQISDLNWHHVAATYTGGYNSYLYIDGVEKTGWRSNNESMTNGLGGIWFGAMIYTAYPPGDGLKHYTDYFQGWIDEPAVYNQVLTPAQIAAHYAAGDDAIAGFDRYEVHRSSTAGFTPSAETLIATIGDSAIQTYRDTTAKREGTFKYRVLTVAAAGSLSSNEVSATLPPDGRGVVTIQPGVAGAEAKATTITSASTCANLGGSEQLTLDSASRALLHFDLRSLPTGSVVESAELGLFTFSSAAASVAVHALKAEWQEGNARTASCNGSGASWAERVPSVAWTAAGGDFEPNAAATDTVGGADPHWESWNLGGLIQDWLDADKPNLGLLLKHTTETGAPALAYTSDDYATSLALRPKLLVTYQDGSHAAGPQVALSQPGPGALMRGSVSLAAGASDDGKVASVEFLVGSTVIATDTAAPYTASWDSTSVANGTKELSVRATDNAGIATTTQPVEVTVGNSAAPSVSVSAATGSSYRSTVLADTPVSYWRLGEATGTAAADEQGANAGTYTNSPTLGQPGALGGDANTSTRLDGTNDYVNVADSASLDLGDTLSIELWFKRTGTGTLQNFVNKGSGAYAVQLHADGHIALRKASTADVVKTTVPVTDTTSWHHFVATKAAGTVKLYLDGADVTGTVTNQTLANNANPLQLGRTTSGGGSEYLAAYLDEVALYATALTATRVTAHYDARNGGAAGVAATATASDDVSVTKVEFYADGHRFDTDTSAPYSATWDTADGGPLPGYDGSHAITARAYDGHGQVTTSTAQNVALSATAGTQYKAAFSSTAVPIEVRDETQPGAGLDTLTVSGNEITDAVRQAGDSGDGRGSDSSFGIWGATTNLLTKTEPDPIAAGSWVSGTGPTRVALGDGRYRLSGGTGGLATFRMRVNLADLVNGETYTASIFYANKGPGVTADWCDVATVAMPDASGEARFTTTGARATYDNTYRFFDVQVPAGVSVDVRWPQVERQPIATPFVPAPGARAQARVQAPASLLSPSQGWFAARVRMARGSADPLYHEWSRVFEYRVDATNRFTAYVGYAAQPNRVAFSYMSGGTNSEAGTLPSWNRGDVLTIIGSWGTQVGISVNGAAFTSMTRTAPVLSGAAELEIGEVIGVSHINGEILWAAGGSGTLSNADAATIHAYGNDAPNSGWPANSAPSLVWNADTAAYETPTSAPAAQASPLDITLTNTSTQTWPTATTKLRYTWYSADSVPVTSSSADISIGATDVPASGNRVVRVDVLPPVLPTGVLRARYRLRLDLYDTVTGSSFAAKGNAPFERWVTVTRAVAPELGLERYQQYDGEALGGGFDNAVNVANGNNVIQWVPFNQPGRGLNTVATLTYNSLEHGSISPVGNNWSLAISGLTPFGLPLDVHPNAADTLAGRNEKWVAFTDADGSYHRFNGNTVGTYYTAPAGVNLYLRYDAAAAADRRWALTKPDRTTFFFDAGGHPTRVEDKDGNALVYTLAAVGAGEDAYGLTKRVTTVTDAGGRDFTIAYLSGAEAVRPALRGKVKSITDHVGHRLLFEYYEDGNLRRIVEEGGSNADGSHLPDRAAILTYLAPDGSGPAIATPADRRTADPTTVQSPRLFSLIDFRGNETTFAYGTSGAAQTLLTGRTNRAGKTTTFTYNAAARRTTVAKPLNRDWTYSFDAAGRATRIDDPVHTANTIVEWTGRNTVSKVTAPNGTTQQFFYNDNGQLTEKRDELGNRTTLAYEHFPVDGNDVAGNWGSARSSAHISRLLSVTQPVGNATTGDPNDYKITFTYTDNVRDRVGQVTDPLGHQVTNTYNADGTLRTQQQPSTGDGITRLTTIDEYDANGLPTRVIDAAEKITRAEYAANGNLLSAQDPNHAAYSGGNASEYRTVMQYDSFGRPGRTSTPKSTRFRRGVLIWTGQSYDANDNVVASVGPHYGRGDSGNGSVTATVYDVMDRPTTVTSPRKAADGSPIRSETVYDDAGRPVLQTAPKGVATAPVGQAWTKDYATETTYDLLDRVSTVTQYAVGADGLVDATKTRTTANCFDRAGDLRSVTAPKGVAAEPGGFACQDVNTIPYQITSVPFTTKLTYDAAHRQTKTTNALGQTTQVTYDENGQVKTTTDANGAVTTNTYDARGARMKEVGAFDGARTLTTLWEYDAIGNLKRLISPRAYDAEPDKNNISDYVTRYSYDALNRLVKTSLPAFEPAAGSPLYPDAVLADSPLAYWRLDDIASTIASDASPNARHASYANLGSAPNYALQGNPSASASLNSSFKTTTWWNRWWCRGGNYQSVDATLTPSVSEHRGTLDASNRDPGCVDQYNLRAEAEVTPAYSQLYTIYATADDGIRVWVGGELKIDYWGDQAATTRTATVSLTAGQRTPIVVEHYENVGDQRIVLEWSSASQARTVITGLAPAYAYGSGINLANSSFTVEAWAKRAGTGTSDWILGQGNATNNNELYFGFRGSSNGFSCSFWGNDFDLPATYTDNAWHHWACTYDATTNSRKIYRDGILVGTNTAIADYAGSGTFYVGRAAYGKSFDGHLDEVAVYGAALSAARIEAHHTAARPPNLTTPQAYVHNAYDDNGNQTLVSLPTLNSDPANLGAEEKSLVDYWDTGAIYRSVDPGTPAVRFDYSAEGWQSARLPDKSTVVGTVEYAQAMYWDYLPDGLQKALRDLGGERATYTYDVNGQKTQSYEATGLTEATQKPLTITYQYDGFGQPLEESLPKEAVPDRFIKTRYTYDRHGNVVNKVENAEEGGTDPAVPGRTLLIDYDQLDRPTLQTDDFGTPQPNDADDEQVAFTYTDTGLVGTRVVSKKSGGSFVPSQTATKTYFDNGLLETLENKDGAGGVVEHHTLGYITNDVYLNGNRGTDLYFLKPAEGTTAPCNADTNKCTTTYTYDARERLVREETTPGVTPASREYLLDVLGNMVEERENTATTVQRAYSGQQLVTQSSGGTTNRYIHDRSGNVDCVTNSTWTQPWCPSAASGLLKQDYVYDYKNRFSAFRAYSGSTQTNSSTYTYDSLDRPVKQVDTGGTAATTTLTYEGSGTTVASETIGSDTNTYAQDPFGTQTSLTRASNRYTYAHDPHRSVSIVLGSDQAVKASYGYSAYGAASSSLTRTATSFAASANPYRYTGKRYDGGSDTYDMGARRYSAGTARFLQRDQYHNALNNLGLGRDRLSANRYALAGGNPINFVEYDGHVVIGDPENIGGDSEIESDAPPGPPDCIAACDNDPPDDKSPVVQDGGSLCVASGGLNCLPIEWQLSSWQSRISWIYNVRNNRDLGGWLGGWLDVFTGVLSYFRDSEILANSNRTKAMDAWVFFFISRGLGAAIAGEEGGGLWGDFFRLYFFARDRGISIDSTLKNLWGRAEQQAINEAQRLTENYVMEAKEEVWFLLLKGITNEYRSAVRDSRSFSLGPFTILSADPRKDAKRVYDIATYAERQWLDCQNLWAPWRCWNPFD